MSFRLTTRSMPSPTASSAAIRPGSARSPSGSAQPRRRSRRNNQAETAFYVRGESRHALLVVHPWLVEVDLCGHATWPLPLIFKIEGFAGPRIEFDSRSGLLTVRRHGERLCSIFRSDQYAPVAVPELLAQGLVGRAHRDLQGQDRRHARLRLGRDRGGNEAGLRASAGCPPAASSSPPAAARRTSSRRFAPQVGIDEDPVTGWSIPRSTGLGWEWSSPPRPSCPSAAACCGARACRRSG